MADPPGSHDTRMRRRRTVMVAAAVATGLVAAGLLVLAPPDGTPDGPGAYELTVMSSPPHLVSGGETRVRVATPPGRSSRVTITVDGVDVTDRFETIDSTHLEGRIVDLAAGPTPVEVRSPEDGTLLASLTLINHPVTGPMFSGPHQEPFLCSTASHRATAELGPPLDDDCTAERITSFKYRTTSGVWADYEPGARPVDMSRTTTMDGRTVDYIVRWERGTINRFLYSLAVLSPDTQDTDQIDLSAWNRRLIYSFQGGVGIGRYQGNPSPGSMLYEPGLARGYAVAYSTGTTTGTHGNLELGGETALMVKGRFVAAYGVPDYTLGIGASGGALQQYVYGQNHPGLLDAAVAVQSYPDLATQMIHIGDCELIERWFDMEVLAGVERWADWETRTLIEGSNASNDVASPFGLFTPFLPGGSSGCVRGWRGLTPLALNPRYGWVPGTDPAQQDGTEWTLFADSVNVYGSAASGYARRPWDNVGVQYGLGALIDGDITVEEFLDLNAEIGSWKDSAGMVQERCPFLPTACPSPPELLAIWDRAGVWPDLIDVWSAHQMELSPDGGATPAARAAADPEAVAAAFEHGFVFTGEISIPVIDWRPYLEDRLDRHAAIHSFAARQRMLDHDGDASNQVIWMVAAPPRGGWFDLTPVALEVIEEWMTGVAGGPPDRAVDTCFGIDGEVLYAGGDAWEGILDNGPSGPCTVEFPVYSTSRIVAGGPISGDVFKCHLQSVEAAIAAGIYGGLEFSPAQRERLREIFPDGVCDYRRGDSLRP